MASISNSEPDIWKTNAGPTGHTMPGGRLSLPGGMVIGLFLAEVVLIAGLRYGSRFVSDVRGWHEHQQVLAYREQCVLQENCGPLITYDTEQCRAGQAAPCDELGQQTERKSPGSTAALRYYEQACAAGLAAGCLHNGLMLDHGCNGPAQCLQGIVRANEALAAERYASACQAGAMAPEACSNLGYMYLHGRGVPFNPQLALELFQRGCPSYPLSCSNLGFMLDKDRGYNLPIDHAAAEGYYLAGCNGGDAWGCHNLAEDYWEHDGKVLAPRSREKYEQACSLGHAESCILLGRDLASQGTSEALEGALGQFRRACDLGQADDQPAKCVNLAYFYLLHPDVAIAENLAPALDRGCSAGERSACVDLGLMYEVGRGVSVDLSQSAHYYDKGCQWGEPAACNSLATQYEKGRGVEKNQRHARELYQQACDGQDQNGCDNLDRLRRAP